MAERTRTPVDAGMDLDVRLIVADLRPSPPINWHSKVAYYIILVLWTSVYQNQSKENISPDPLDDGGRYSLP